MRRPLFLAFLLLPFHLPCAAAAQPPVAKVESMAKAVEAKVIAGAMAMARVALDDLAGSAAAGAKAR
jgi:hypothetical protein